MSELIRRSDAIEAVWELDKDANEYVVYDAKEIHGYCTAIGVCVGELSALPSADAVEVVRCKDCRHWNSETNGCKRNPSVEAWYETDFCKYGKRRKDEGD